MKKSFILLLLIPLLMTSCHAPSYTFDGASDNFGIEFRKGKWLLYDIEAPTLVVGKLNDLARENFSEYLKTALYYPENLTGVILPKVNGTNISRSTLSDIKNGSDFDYFININAEKIRDDIGALQIGDINSYQKNEAQVVLEIYDLNSLERIYFQKMIGTIEVENDTSDFKFSKSAEGIIMGAFKRIMKKVDRDHSYPNNTKL